VSSDHVSSQTECAVIGRSHGELGRFTTSDQRTAHSVRDEMRSDEMKDEMTDMNAPYAVVSCAFVASNALQVLVQ